MADDAPPLVETSNVGGPSRFSYLLIIAAVVLAGALHLGVLLLSMLFSYFALTKLNFLKHRGRWVAVAMFIVLGLYAAYGLGFFVRDAAEALPRIAEKAIPAITGWAAKYNIVLPFTDLETLKEEAVHIVKQKAGDFNQFADFARGATREFIYLTMGWVIAMALFLHPTLELDSPVSEAHRGNLYSLCCKEISRRFTMFYKSFELVMEAQVTISALNAVLTAIFMWSMGLKHVLVAVGITFICGLIPVIGNLISNTVVVAIGFLESPAKGIGALCFLVAIHHLGFVVSGKILGEKIRSPVWLTLLGLMIGERLMGITGMILAPVVLHYIRVEASLISPRLNKVTAG